jgi:hypothetical protein
LLLGIAGTVLLPLTVAVNATNRPPGPLGAAAPARYGLAYQDAAFRSHGRAGTEEKGAQRDQQGLARASDLLDSFAEDPPSALVLVGEH